MIILHTARTGIGVPASIVVYNSGLILPVVDAGCQRWSAYLKYTDNIPLNRISEINAAMHNSGLLILSLPGKR